MHDSLKSANPGKLAFWLIVGVMAVPFAAIFVRYAQAQGMPVLVIAMWRLIFAWLLLGPYALITYHREISSFSACDWLALSGAGICLGLHFAGWIGSLAYTSVAVSVVLVATGPLFVGIGSWLFLKERLSRNLVLAIVIAGTGSLVMCGPDLVCGHQSWLGDLLALGGALSVAGYFILGRSVRGRCSLIAYITPVYGVATLTLIALVLCSGQPVFGYAPAAYGWALLLGWIPQLIGHTILNWSLRYLSATLVAMITLIEPIGSALLAYLLIGERLNATQGLGGTIILLGIYLAMRPPPSSLDSDGSVPVSGDSGRV